MFKQSLIFSELGHVLPHPVETADEYIDSIPDDIFGQWSFSVFGDPIDSDENLSSAIFQKRMLELNQEQEQPLSPQIVSKQKRAQDERQHSMGFGKKRSSSFIPFVSVG